MAAPLPCDSCGSPIPDSDLETGSAVTLLGKRYCSSCKTEAIQNVSLDELSGAPAPAGPKRPVPPLKAAPSATRAKPQPSRRSAVVKAPSRAPLLIAAAAVGLAVLVAAVFAFKGNPPPPEPATPSKPPTSSGTGPAPDREGPAREAYARVEELTRRTGISWDLVLAAADKARPACRGTDWEKKLEELRSKAARERDAEEASRELIPLLDELKGAVATDPEFKRYSELQPKFQLALEMAGKTGSVRMPEVRALQKEYNGKYEKLAEPYYNEINEAATALAEERRYDDALRKIATFPQPLRQSGAWLSLDKLRKDIERRKTQLPPKKK